MTIRPIIGVRAKKNVEPTLLFVDYFKVFDSTTRGKNWTKYSSTIYGLPQETDTAKMMFFKNIRLVVFSPGFFFHIGTGVMQENRRIVHKVISFTWKVIAEYSYSGNTLLIVIN